MENPAKFAGTAKINGKDVSFFTPPHNEPDFLWVDLEELAGAFLPPEDAKRMVQHSYKLFPGTRPVATVRNGDRIATIVCHSMAQGFCGFIDHLNGHIHGEDMTGPAHTEYCFASAGISDHLMSFEDIFAAFKNNGGPFMRDVREE